VFWHLRLYKLGRVDPPSTDAVARIAVADVTSRTVVNALVLRKRRIAY